MPRRFICITASDGVPLACSIVEPDGALRRALIEAQAKALKCVALAQEPVRIGAINPYSGPVALYGDEVARGYQLAIDEANAKGGVIGRKIELFRGDAGNPQQGIAAIEKLVSDKVDIFEILCTGRSETDVRINCHSLHADICI